MEGYCDMRGYLSFLVLHMISKKNLSGEDIRLEIKKRKGTKPSAGTIYPVLKNLSSFGLIEELKSKGKEKKYKITKKGEAEVKLATKKFCSIFCDIEFNRN